MNSVIQEVERDSYCFSVYRMIKLLLQNEDCKVSLNLDYFPFGSILIHSPISLAELNLKCRKDKTFRLKTCTRDIEKNEFIRNSLEKLQEKFKFRQILSEDQLFEDNHIHKYYVLTIKE